MVDILRAIVMMIFFCVIVGGFIFLLPVMLTLGAMIFIGCMAYALIHDEDEEK